jgi:hypothetical protein
MSQKEFKITDEKIGSGSGDAPIGGGSSNRYYDT